ncbi:hypothetical protein [Mycobacterium sp. 3519A]|jgi:hypothetical protein|uniref:DUF7489 domain-containing protein n=1 Tax=Mycobacterium sp. 3519A TaxID=2057184 RepID=UPI000C7AE9A9|nr:hypothetical protein [Mycobacterium sp. 3519A]
MSSAEWEGTVVKKYRALLDGANLYRRVLVQVDGGQTVKVRVDRTMWEALAIGDAVKNTPGGLQKA